MYVHVPDELKPFEEDLSYFMNTMVRLLHINRHKGTDTCPIDVLVKGLEGEVKEVKEALYKDRSQFDTIFESADVANFAFLIALSAMRLEKPEFLKEVE